MAEPTVREILEEQVNAHSEAENEVIENPITERNRDESGRFAKSEEQKEQVKTPVEAKEQETQKAEIQPEPQELPQLQRPTSWKKELWAVWDKMAAGQPLTAQEARQVAEYNVNREQQFAGGVSTYKQEAERAKPLLEAIAPFQQEMAQHGIEAPTMIRNLLAAQRSLALGSPQQKLGMIAQICRDYGIPLQAFSDQNIQNQYLATPHVQPPQPQVDINQAIQQALAERDNQQTIQQMASNTQKYPFFPYVRLSMAQLLESGEITDLDEAYQRALELPEHSMLSTALQQQQNIVEEQRKLETAKKTAQVARANNLSPKSATPTIAPVNGKASVREALEEAISAHRSDARV